MHKNPFAAHALGELTTLPHRPYSRGGKYTLPILYPLDPFGFSFAYSLSRYRFT